MYQLEDRILFDGAAAIDVANAAEQAEEAQQEQQEQHEQQQEQQEQQQDTQAHNSETQDAAAEQPLAADLPDNAASDADDVNVLVISDALENADELFQAASSDTIVVRYDARTTTAAQLLDMINDALAGKKADSIGFAVETKEGALLNIFSDETTSVNTISDQIQQQFWNGVEDNLDSDGRVDILSSDLAASDNGLQLVNSISETVDHDVAASTDTTGGTEAGGDWVLEHGDIDISEVYFSADEIGGFDSVLDVTPLHEVAFINDTVEDSDTIVASLGDDVEIVYLSGDVDGLEQINAYLSESDVQYDTVRIFTDSNGTGRLELGAVTISEHNVDNYADQLESIGEHITQDGDILIYSCNLAANETGQNLSDALAALTSADVAASKTIIGVDGNWSLEYSTGVIESSAIAVDGYLHNLAATITVNNMTDDPLGSLGEDIYTLRKALYYAADGDTISFAAWSTLEGTLPAGAELYTINLNASLGELDVNVNVTIDGYIDLGSGAYTFVRVDARPLENGTIGTATTRVFFVKADYSETEAGEAQYVTFSNMIIQNGYAVSTGGTDPSDGNGGAVYIDVNSTVIMQEVSIRNSEADISGGGIYNAGDLTVQSTTTKDTTEICWNTAGNSGGGIFNGSTGTLTVVGGTHSGEGIVGEIITYSNIQIYSNEATAGSGGGIYSVTDITIEKSSIYYNTAAAGSGGAIAIESGNDNSVFYFVNMYYNTAEVNGGGISYTQGNDLNLEYCYIYGNRALTGNGGAVYFAHNSGDLTISTNGIVYVSHASESVIRDNYAAGNGGAIYIDQSGDVNVDFVNFYNNVANENGGAFYITNSGAVTFSDVNITYCRAGLGGGAVYYDSGAFSIATSCISYNTAQIVGGGGIYQLAGALAVTNSTLAYNNGGAIYLGAGNLELTFSTLAYNSNSSKDGASIYIDGKDGANCSLSIINTIIYNDSLDSNSQIYVPDSNFTVESFIHNIYSHWYIDADNNPSNSISYDKVTVAGNITGTNSTETDYIKSNLYLDTELRYHANYRTMALAILYDDSIAYTAGMVFDGITHDQRGNTRIGYDVDGNANSTPSIGAFEPIYYVTVTSKGDDSQLIYSMDENAEYFDIAMASGDGLTLREAVYWLDTYDRSEAFDAGLYNADRWVKFDPTVFTSNGDNTITLTFGQIEIGDSVFGNDSSKEIMISSVEVVNPRDSRNYGDINDPVAYLAQNNSSRITVDGNANDGIFLINGTSNAYINNLTLTNGYEDNYSDGSGGGIQNYEYVILNNVVVSNCTVDNIDTRYYDGGFGGGIYNSGTMYIYDSTITGNTAIAYGNDTLGIPNRAGLGGGIYNDFGTLFIERSTIDNNTVSGEAAKVNEESLKGAGIYNYGGYLLIANSTIAENLINAASNAGNTAGMGAAVYSRGSNLYLYYNTIVNNHTDLNSSFTLDPDKAAVAIDSGSLYLSNSILADNTVQLLSSPKVQEYSDIYINNTATTINVTVEITGDNGDYNIIGSYNYDADTGDGYNWDVRHNQIGDSFGYVVNLNMDDTLRYNGAKTMTYRLLDGSVAVGTGTLLTSSLFTSLATDQRGVSRTMEDRNGNIVQNIGSYESLTMLTVTSNTDSGTEPTTEGYDFANDNPGWAGDDVTIRDAIYWADTEALISFDDTGWTSEVVYVQTQAINITNGITINGWLNQLNTSVVLDANYQHRIFVVDNVDYLPLVSVGLTNMVLQHGDAFSTSYNGHGGAIYSKETLTLNKVTVQNSYAAGKGGGIFSQTGNLTLLYSTISNNSSSSGGGGVYTEANVFSASYSSILANSTSGEGGGVFALGSTVLLNASTVGNNDSSGSGGGLYINSSAVSMLNSTIANNNAGLNGGGIVFAAGGTFDLDFVTIANNISGVAQDVQKYGGGIYMAAGDLTITNSVIANNYQSEIDGTRDDFYLTGGNVISATYNAVGASTNYVFLGSDHNITPDTNPDFYEEIGLDSILSDNDGPTLTVYVMADSLLLNAATPGSGTTVTVDQRGVSRPATGQPTIGAYQKNVSVYTYNPIESGGVNNVNNWELTSGSGGIHPDNFTAPDQTFIFDNDTETVDSDWAVSYKNTVIIESASDITVDSGAIMSGYFLITGGVLSVNNGTFNVTGGNPLVANNSSTITINNNGIMTGNVVLKDSSSLTINTADANVANLTINSVEQNSTVAYTFAGNQTVKTIVTGNYGNLTIAGGGIKAAYNNITVTNDFVLNDSSTLNADGYDIQVIGSTSGTGNITGQNIILADTNLTGNINGTGAVTINALNDVNIAGNITGNTAIDITTPATINILGNSTGGSISFDGTAVNIEGALNSASTVTITGALDIIGNIDAISEIIINSSADIIGSVTSGSSISFAGVTDITGNVVASTTVDFDDTAALRNGTLTATTLTTNGLALDQANLTVDTLTMNAALSTIAGTDANSIKYNTVKAGTITGLNNGITVNDYSVLTMDNGSSPINLDGTDVANFTVTLNGVLEFKTTGNITVDVDTAPANLLGTLKLTGQDIDLSGGANFANAEWLIVNNSGMLTMGSEIKAHNLAFAGDVELQDNTALEANSIQFLGTVQSEAGSTYDLTLTALAGDVIVNDAINIGALTINATDTASVGKIIADSLSITAPNGTTVNGSIQVANNAFFDSPLTINGNVEISANTVTGSALIIDAANLTDSLVLNVTNGTLEFGQIGATNAFALTVNVPGMATFNSSVNILDGIFNTATFNGNLTAQDLTFNGGTTFADGISISLGGDWTSLSSVTGTTNILFNGLDAQVINAAQDVSFQNFEIDNNTVTDGGVTAVGAGKLNVNGDFIFNGTKFYLGNSGGIFVNNVVDFTTSSYFVTDGTAMLYRNVNSTLPTEFVVGSEDHYVSLMIWSAPGTNGTVGFRTFESVTANGQINGKPIQDLEKTQKYTTVIDSGLLLGKLNGGVTGTNIQAGSQYNPVQALDAFYSNGAWSNAQPTTAIYAWTSAMPGTNFEPFNDNALNNSQQNDRSLPPIVIDNPDIDDPQNPFFRRLELAFTASSEFNPLGDTETRQSGMSRPLTLTAFGGVDLTGGQLSVFGAPDGEYGITVETLPDYLPSESFLPATEWEFYNDFEDFSSYADLDMDKVPNFKSDVDKMLDELMAS